MIVTGIYIDRAGALGGKKRAQDVRKEGKNINEDREIDESGRGPN